MLYFNGSANAYVLDIEESCLNTLNAYKSEFNQARYLEGESAWKKYKGKRIRIDSEDSEKVKYFFDMLVYIQKIEICETMISKANSLNNKKEFIEMNWTLNQVSMISEELYSDIKSSINSFISGGSLGIDVGDSISSSRKVSDKKIDSIKTPDYINSNLNKGTSIWKSQNPRQLAKNDVVAQVLNYASGVPEDASGTTFFYPTNTENGQCIYKISIDKNSPMGAMTNEIMGGLVEAGKFASAMTGQRIPSDPSSALTDGIDLNKGDLKNINFYKLQGAKRNKFTGMTAYLRYQSRVEGLPDLFECDSNSCNIDRLKRGWALVASKCKGTKKAF